MDNTPPGPAERAALLSLLDDPSPAVRRSLLAHFTNLGPAAASFLQDVMVGPNRLLARHASSYLDELRLTDPITEFRHFIRSSGHELETGVLLLARTASPRLDTTACSAQLDDIAARCRELFADPSSLRDKCRVMNRVLFHEWSFHGNLEHYTDPRNSFIDQVLERRTGIPVTLSIVYLLVASRLRLPLLPIGLPGHFLVGCLAAEPAFFVDPFDGGLFRDPGEILDLLRIHHFAPSIDDITPASPREVLCRCCRNLVNHYTVAGDPGRARLFSAFVDEFEASLPRQTLG